MEWSLLIEKRNVELVALQLHGTKYKGCKLLDSWLQGEENRRVYISFRLKPAKASR